MDENNNQDQAGSNMNQDQNVEGKQTVKARFKGTDGSEGYQNGAEYTLQKWEQDGKIFISLQDGSGQVAYDTAEAMEQNWQMVNEDEGGMQTP